jgi:hypothetical protein
MSLLQMAAGPRIRGVLFKVCAVNCACVYHRFQTCVSLSAPLCVVHQLCAELVLIGSHTLVLRSLAFFASFAVMGALQRKCHHHKPLCKLPVHLNQL